MIFPAARVMLLTLLRDRGETGTAIVETEKDQLGVGGRVGKGRPAKPTVIAQQR